MAITGGGNIFIFEQDYGFNIRGAWSNTATYAPADVVYYGSPAISYLAQATIAANVIPTTPNSGWARLAARGIDGDDGPEGRYTILLFARSNTEPRAPNNTDAVFPADPANFSSTIWTRASIPSGTDTLWMSFITVRPSSSALNFGQVTRISGEDGTDGSNAAIEFSDNQNGPWSTSSSSSTEYVRLRVGTGAWSTAIRIKGEPGTPGESAQMQFSPDGSTDWVTTARSTDKFIRFRIGNTGMWTIPLQYRGRDGDPGASLSIQFSADNSNWHSGDPVSGDEYIRFIIGSSPPSAGIKFVGIDGRPGADSFQIQYNSSTDAASFHDDLRNNDEFIRFRIGTGAWSVAKRFVGQHGAAAPNVQIEFSADGNRWENTPRTNDVWIRFSNDNGTTWTNAARFVGHAGAGGESVSIEYSIDGQAAWHTALTAADYFIRLQVGTRGWSTGVQFRAYPLMIQYSIDGSTLWHTGFVTGTDKYIRFSNDNGVTWTTGERFVGEDGDDSLEVQYSDDNSTWVTTLAVTNRYIRFRLGGTGAWSTGIRFVGFTGGFIDTFFQRLAATPLAPLNLEYDWDNNSYRNLGNGWSTDVPTGTNTLWKIHYFVPPRTEASEIVTPALRGSIYNEKGTDGTDGSSIRIIYLRKTGAAPPTPTGGTWNGTAYTEAAGWSLSQPVGTATLYGSIVALSGTDKTNSGISYSTVLKLESQDGSSIDFIYRRSATVLTIGPSNTGITATGGVLNNVPSGWSLTIPGGTDPLYASIASITSNVSFSEPVRLTGISGIDGSSIRTIYARSEVVPSRPTNGTGTWNGSDYDPPNGWHESIESAPASPGDLYTCVVTLSGSDKTNTGIRYDQIIRFSPRDGNNATGIGQTEEEVIFGFVQDQSSGRRTVTSRRSQSLRNSWMLGTTDYKNFTGGNSAIATQDNTGITVATDGIYSVETEAFVTFNFGRNAPGGGYISLLLQTEDSEGNLGDRFLLTRYAQSHSTVNVFRQLIGSTPPFYLEAGSKIYLQIGYQVYPLITGYNSGAINGLTDAIEFIVDAGSNTIDSSTPDTKLVLRRYTTASEGGSGGGTGNSIDVIYRRSSTALTVAPTGGTASDGRLETAPTDWSTTVPSGTDVLYTSFAHIDGSDNSIIYDEPVRWTGEQGLSEVSVWTRAANRPGVPGALRFNQDTTLNINTAGGLTWHRDPAISGTEQLWRATVVLDTNENPPDKTWLGSPIADGAGTDGTNGNSVQPIYRRSSSQVSGIPSNAGITATNGRLNNAPTGWSLLIPGGSDDLYKSDGNIAPDGTISFSAAYLASGEKGDKGDSLQLIYRASVNSITARPTGGTASNGQLTAAPTDWDLVYPGGSVPVWIAVAHIDGSTVTYSRPQRFSGPTGTTGAGGSSVTFFFQRTAANTAPNRPAALTYNGTAFGGLESWVPGGANAGSGRYLWILLVQYRVGVNGSQRVGSPFQFGGIDGANGFGYQYFYHANAADTVSSPTIEYNGTTFNNVQSGWATTIPTTPAGANIFLAAVRYQVGTAGQTVEGVVRLGVVPGAVTPPPVSRTTYANGVTYGLADDSNNPVGTAVNSPAFSLAVGESHSTPVVAMPRTTTIGDNYYVTLPAGLTLTGVTDSFEGPILAQWTRVGMTQTWVYTIGFADNINTMGFTVRRDS